MISLFLGVAGTFEGSGEFIVTGIGFLLDSADGDVLPISCFFLLRLVFLVFLVCRPCHVAVPSWSPDEQPERLRADQVDNSASSLASRCGLQVAAPAATPRALEAARQESLLGVRLRGLRAKMQPRI